MQTEFLRYQSGILMQRTVFSPAGVEAVDYDLYTAEAGKAYREGAQGPNAALHRLWTALQEKPLDGEGGNVDGRNYRRSACPEAGGLQGVLYADMHSPAPVDVLMADGAVAAFLITGRNDSLVVVRPGYEALTPLPLWEKVSRPDCTVHRLGTCMVPMRDGVLLATEVHCPNGEGPFPAILIRTCYGRNEGRAQWDKYARRGYAVVVQDVRGRHDSQGEWQPFVHEREDGGDTLEWIAAQPWSNGKVGMLGGSYLGYVQWAAAASGSPYLKALVSQVAAGSPFTDLPRRGGTFGSGILAWSFMVAKQVTDPMATVREDWDQLLAHRPICEIPERGLGTPLDFYDEWMRHPDGDAYWDLADWSLHSEKIDVPALYVSGWFDDDGPGTTLAWEMNRKKGRANQRMILGPWLHKTNSTRRIHNYTLPANALLYDLDLQYLRWFDHFLKGVENGVGREEAVRYYQLGENVWRTASQWPPIESRLRSWYLGAGGTLSEEAAEEQSAESYVSDPADPFPYKIDVSENECAVPEEYTLEEQRPDVLLYTSAVLEQPLEIAGSAKVQLYAASSAPDTDWVVRLTDVAPDGTSTKLCDGILRARYREGFHAPKLLEPGEICRYEITMTRIAHTFLPGHRVRLQVTSGADNLCFANSQTGGNECTVTELRCATQTVYAGGETASAVLLPVAERPVAEIPVVEIPVVECP